MTAVLALQAEPRLVALVGNPNCGKTALFNRLTGSHQKVANYAGVTVERKEGALVTPMGEKLRLLDLPGTYSLDARSPDEALTCKVLQGIAEGEDKPDLVICVLDATNLRRGLRFVLAVRRLGLPLIVALNMADLAAHQGLKIDTRALAAQLGVPVISTVAVKPDGAAELTTALDSIIPAPKTSNQATSIHEDHAEVRRILAALGLEKVPAQHTSDKIDRWLLHPVLGPIVLLAVLFLIFQAVFSWAQWPMDLIETAANGLGVWIGGVLPHGMLRSLLVDGVIAGAGGVIVFLPQIVILFFFILLLEEIGYLPRAAFLLDRLMGGVGLSGRSFIPLLSSFACAIPGIMATRTIQNPRDRWVTIMIAPLMTCSARLPVYALLIGAFIPVRSIGPGLNLQGLVLFALYFAGIVAALIVALTLKRFANGTHARQLMMELPAYHLPAPRNIAIGLWQRAMIFLSRVGGIILALTIILWFISSFPAPPAGATGAAIEYSLAGRLGSLLSHVFAPIGFNWQISIALVPGLAAREVAVSALGTVYALSAGANDVNTMLSSLIAKSWSLPTALSLLAWYVFAPQCLATLVAVKREMGSWKAPIIMAAYLFALAYVASFITYRLALAWGLS